MFNRNKQNFTLLSPPIFHCLKQVIKLFKTLITILLFSISIIKNLSTRITRKVIESVAMNVVFAVQTVCQICVTCEGEKNLI